MLRCFAPSSSCLRVPLLFRRGLGLRFGLGSSSVGALRHDVLGYWPYSDVTDCCQQNYGHSPHFAGISLTEWFAQNRLFSPFFALFLAFWLFILYLCRVNDCLTLESVTLKEWRSDVVASLIVYHNGSWYPMTDDSMTVRFQNSSRTAHARGTRILYKLYRHTVILSS